MATTFNDVYQKAAHALETITSNADSEFESFSEPEFDESSGGSSWTLIGDTPKEKQPATYTATTVTPPTVTITMPDIGDINLSSIDIAVPSYAGTKPTITIPQSPSVLLPDAPVKSFSFTAPAIPSAPIIEIPDIPTLLSGNIVIPPLPTIDIPVYDYQPPEFNIDPPTNNFTWAEDKYFSKELDDIREKVHYDLMNGGYGIEVADEQRLWVSARERENKANYQNQQQFISDLASRGFKYVTGAMVSGLERLRSQEVASSVSLSRDIAIKKADIYIENRKFTIQQAQEIEKIFINVYMSQWERALNVKKFMATNILDYYKEMVNNYNAKLEAFKTHAQVFESRVRAALTAIEIYKGQLAAEQLKGDIDKTKIELYIGQIRALDSIVGIYRSQVDGAKVLAEIESLKLQAYKNEVDAYGATVQAKEAEFRMYDGQIKGELAKAQLYEADVKAYATLIDGIKTKADIAKSNISTKIDEAKIRLDLAKQSIELQKANADIAIQASNVSIANARNQNEVAGINARLVEAYAQTQARMQEADVRAEEARLSNKTEEFKAKISKYNAIATAQYQFKGKKLDMYSERIAAALGSASGIIVKQE